MRKTGKPLFENEEQAKKACYEFVDKIVGDDQVVITKNSAKSYRVDVKTKRVIWYNYPHLSTDALMSVSSEENMLVLTFVFNWNE